MKRVRLEINNSKYAGFGDLKFPRKNPLADYDSTWDNNLTERKFITVTQCQESSVLFCAREGWINSKAPLCHKPECSRKNSGITMVYVQKILKFLKYSVWSPCGHQIVTM